MATITITIDDKLLVEGLSEAAEQLGLDVKNGVTADKIVKLMVSDLETSLESDLSGFFQNGIDCDVYSSLIDGELMS